MSGWRAALEASEPVRIARRALGDDAGSVWIVGGAPRDALAGREVGDLDLATACDPERVARKIADAAGGAVFELSAEFATWRAVAAGWSADVAALRAETIEADLARRDFTADAIAVPVAGGDPIDPLDGGSDLERGILRIAGPDSFRDDPLRVLRAARIGAAFGLDPEPETVRAAREAAPRAAEPAGERVFAELRGLVAGPAPLEGLALMDRLAATPAVLPELEALRGVTQSANHHLDVYEHTTEVVRRWLDVEADLEPIAGEAAESVAAALAQPLADELTRAGAIRFAALLHDIGKPATRREQDGLISFRGHDRVGAEMIRDLCERLRTSRRFADHLAALTRHHLVLGFMVRERPLSRRRVNDYLLRTGREALDVTLLTVADRLSAQGTGVPTEAIEAHLELAREMLAEIVELESRGRPQPLLDGAEIGELLGLEPGERIGAAVRELEAAQFAGEVSDREAAVEHLEAWSARSEREQ